MEKNFKYCPYCAKVLDVVKFGEKGKMELRCKECKILYPFDWTKATLNTRETKA